MTPYQAGYKCATEGGVEEDCPYYADSAEAEQWLEGFDDGS